MCAELTFPDVQGMLDLHGREAPKQVKQIPGVHIAVLNRAHEFVRRTSCNLLVSRTHRRLPLRLYSCLVMRVIAVAAGSLSPRLGERIRLPANMPCVPGTWEAADLQPTTSPLRLMAPTEPRRPPFGLHRSIRVARRPTPHVLPLMKPRFPCGHRVPVLYCVYVKCPERKTTQQTQRR